MKIFSPRFAVPSGLVMLCFAAFISPSQQAKDFSSGSPLYKLIPAEKTSFNSFVDCNMAEAWVGNRFRIFPGKYGEDPLWGYALELKYADGMNAEEAFRSKPGDFSEPAMPPNAKPGEKGLHGAVWFETVYQDAKDISGNTLFSIYHNENYPSTLPYDAGTGEGYKDNDWPQGLKGPETATAVCRIGIMKSIDGGQSWSNKGIFIEDLQSRLILRPDNQGINFAGGTGDPSAVPSGDYLYLFYGEYGYPGVYAHKSYDPVLEHAGQCISVARIKISELDNPAGKARRWGGKAFDIAYNGIGKPIQSLQIPFAAGGGPASSPIGKYYWGPSVSWNDELKSWVMLMAKAEGPSWKGNSIYISFNQNQDLGIAGHAQEWTVPELLISKKDHILWYPSLQPTDSKVDLENRYTCLRLGQVARLYYKDMSGDSSVYLSEYKIEFGH